MWKVCKLKVLMSGLLGVTLGIFVSLVFNSWFGSGDFTYAPPELINRMGSSLNGAWFFFVGSFVFGVGFYVVSLITELTNMGLWKGSVFHLVLSFCWFMIGGYFLGFATHQNITSFLLNTLSFIGIYCIIWIAIYFHIKFTLAKINRKLNQ